MFDYLEHEAIDNPDQYKSYFLKIKTDDNGHVRVKTVQKEPGKPWETHVEEYDRGSGAIKKGEESKPIEGRPSEKTSTSEQKGQKESLKEGQGAA